MLEDFDKLATADQARDRLVEVFLYDDEFQSRQAHRLSRWLWSRGRKDLAMLIQSRASDIFQWQESVAICVKIDIAWSETEILRGSQVRRR